MAPDGLATIVLPDRVIDFHARLVPEPGAAARLLATMDAFGVERAVVCAGGILPLQRLAYQIQYGGGCANSADNDGVRREVESSSGRLVPFFFGNPHAPVSEYAKDAALFKGLEISPAVHGVGYDDPGMRNLVEEAGRHGHPVYTVCVPATGSTTADLVRLAVRFPSTVFVFGHCGYIGIDIHSIEEVQPYPNIVVELSGCFSITARTAVDRLGADRVLFGTEYPLQHPSTELVKLAALRLQPDELEQVAWRNAVRLLNLHD
jgi:predicted TIM-barrel fold metal-dependent hydrolase